ncbi:MAG: tetratricopeptide repeat protein [Pseudomonadota bacterium]
MRAFLLCLTLCLCIPGLPGAAPTQDDIAVARQDYIAGNYERALAVLRVAAEAGDAVALNIMGAAYDDGNGVAQDGAKAVAFFERAAAAGEIRARHNLGLLFSKGSGSVAPDPARARREFQMAADAGYAFSMTELGRFAEDQTPPDYSTAADWYERAHNAGDLHATGNLAHAFVKGLGRDKDWGLARLLYTQAAMAGNARAFNDLGVMHQYGYGVHADPLTAIIYFQRGVQAGDAKAGINLADLASSAQVRFLKNDAILGYCYWGVAAAKAHDRDGFEETCARLEAEMNANDALRAAALRFAQGL